MRAARMMTLLAGCLLLASCDRQKSSSPRTPEEMYARVQELLRPGVEDTDSREKEAMLWLHRAGEAGYLRAQTDLGWLYLGGGRGIEKDEAEAYRWFSRAAEQGSREAHQALAEMLLRGGAIPRDEAAALEHGRKSAEAGLAEGMLMMGLHLIRTDEGMAEGVEWLRKAAQGKSLRTVGTAARTLGQIYAQGAHGVAADSEKSVHWYMQAAQAGDARAQFIAALMLMRGELMEKDEERGMAYLRMAAGQDYPRAIARLINILRNSGGGETQEREAEAWARRLEELRRKGEPVSSPETVPAPAASQE